MMGLTPPKYDWHHWNDAGIAVGVWVEGIFYAPYDGYILAIGSRGAGQEDWEMRTSRGMPIQHGPSRDIAVDADALNQLQNDPMGLTLGGLMCIINQPVKENERIDINYPNGTGTAEGNVYIIFGRQPIGDGRYHLWQAAEDTVADGSIILECPTAVQGLHELTAGLIRGTSCENNDLILGDNGYRITLPCRAIAVDTDAEPITLQPIYVQMPNRIIGGPFQGASGVAMYYFVFS